jgi:hypothetical protein
VYIQLETKAQRYQFISLVIKVIIGTGVLGASLVFVGWKVLLTALVICLVIYAITIGITKWAESGK